MATFDESQITDIAEILGTNSNVVKAHLDFYAEVITDSDKTAVLARVADYQAVEDDNADIDPRERNFGARISSDKKRSLIRSRIVGLLQAGRISPTGGSRLVRS